MNDIYNADIQEAPVYPVSFQLYDKDGKPIYRLQSECNLSTVIYIPKSIANSFSGQDNFIYLTIMDEKNALYQSYSALPQQLNSMYLLKFNLHIPQCDSPALNLQLAFSNKHSGESGIGESLRIGRFFNSMIPIEDGENDD
ncbi:hypothetical protein LMB42_05425 [Limosilactobacillus reuteri]|uniref:hypothetical protein n=2 Tax=Limosilactobacillus TaxID=2742598 RepID=UPI001E3D1967|nr:hypothetical protein [Limosilactobacillus reuteri]MCC4323694.1 hypothetical protein [Limosilactobacillus reuteri]MCC4333892.1 hypothetical protein [Limosilactobacillus reuteri]MCC4369379.1 hypothetical protein [Limosilactobacillus reuteri]